MTKRTPGPDPFNNPFGKVKLAPPKAPSSNLAPAAAPSKKKEKPVAIDAEAALFLEAMGEVAPVKQGRNRAPLAEPPRQDPVKLLDEEAESVAQLAELVSTDGPLEGDEAQGAVRGFDPQVMRRLRAGQFVRRARVDLHGLTQEQARAALEKLIPAARAEGHRCVLVITGRGLHSPDQVAVLKAGLPQWLARGRLARHVLAFCPAQPSDGGAGATYVLLRR